MQDYLKIVILSGLCLFTNGAIRCEFRKYLVPGHMYYVFSPGYPRNFTTAVNCRWIVTTAPGWVCRLECSQFHLEESTLCATDRFLVSTIGDPLLMTSKSYCGNYSIIEVSEGRRISMSLQASRNRTGGRFHCQVITEKENVFQTPPPISLGTANPKLEYPWSGFNQGNYNAAKPFYRSMS